MPCNRVEYSSPTGKPSRNRFKTEMSNFVIFYFLNLFYTLNHCLAYTHWVVTETGKIVAQEQSIFQMNRPYDLVEFLNQEERANRILQLFAEMKRRKRELNLKWLELNAEVELEKHINIINKECQHLQDIDFYDDVVEYALDSLNYNEFNDQTKTNIENELDCAAFTDLDFSMATFPHLKVLTQPWNLSWARETNINVPLSPGQIYNGLNKNKTSWFLYNLASLYWRKVGDSQRAIDCIKRSVHFASREHKYTPLLNLGVMLQKAQCMAEAAILLHSSVDHAPRNAKGHFALANVYTILGDYERSLDCYNNALKIDPDWSMAKNAKQAILCHNKLNHQLSRLRVSLNNIKTEVHQLTEMQENLRKDQEEIYINNDSPLKKTISQILALEEKFNSESSSDDFATKSFQHYNLFRPVDTDSLSLHILFTKVLSLSNKISEDTLQFLPLKDTRVPLRERLNNGKES
ncbi:tetratricopeptide repeat protein 17 [Cimex lectularius]|uniref:Tetratricopeptide repeat protein 17 n=1 Tax=Cimex lectularius TaxID=79782 RepID=A0A8I6R820_CIMLE|nr:tetratricopeptide repeat protein 17 [Cimex lectularius]